MATNDTDSARDRTGEQTGVPPIEVTPEMVAAGIAALKALIATDDIHNDESMIVVSVYQAMASAQPGISCISS